MLQSKCCQHIVGILVALMIFLVAPKISIALTQTEAEEFVIHHIQSEFGHEPESYDFKNFYFDSGVWSFSVELKTHPKDQDGLIVGSINEKGRLIEIRGPEEISLNRQIEISLKNCYFNPLSVEKFFAFKQEWEPIITSMLDSGIALDDIPVADKYLGVISMNIVLPPMGSISVEEALAKAKESVGSLPGWTAEKVDFFKLDFAVCHIPNDVNIKGPVYHFLFERYSGFDDAYRDAATRQAYYEKIFAAFGGDNGSTPYYISVMIDAQTGDVVEEPIVAIPPVDRHYLDFILR